ncbi:MAG TPA: MFS transporter [Myxococcota bacterium]|nr:MFS transporter [Myxococcota bacterium]
MTTAESTRRALAPEVAAVPRAGTPPLRWVTIFDYVAPWFGLGFMFLLIAIQLMKFGTDVLGIPAAVMGGILFFGRTIWDATVDPVVGFLSDRTKLRLGRRRPWLLASVLPLALTFVWLWTPPRDLGPTLMALWMAAMVVAFYTSMSVLVIPHTALGAELTDNYHDRSRIFGARHVVTTIGSFACVAGLSALQSSTDVHHTIYWLSVGAALAAALGTLWTFVRLRERPEFQGRGAEHPYRAFRDVLRNPHARLLLFVFGIESLGAATIGVLTPYVAEYVVRRPEAGPPAIGLYMVANVVFVPVWLPMSRRFGKKSLWLGSMLLTAVSFGAMIFLKEGSLLLLNALAFLAGTAASCGNMLAPSIQADVIDWDEHATGERKEGAYFAAWNFVFKWANGLTLLLTGMVLSFSGFVPNADQSPGVKFTILALYGLFPLACYTIGAALFLRFRLDAEGYALIRAELDSRR